MTVFVEDKSVEELVALYLAESSQEAAAELLTRFGGMVHAVVRNVLTNPADVDDVYQETWLKVFRALHTLREPARFGGWLKHTAARTALDHVRRGSKIVDLRADVKLSFQERTDAVMQIEVRQAVNALPEHYRQAVALYYFVDLPCSEIAEILGIPAGTVMSRLRKGREILERKLILYQGEGFQ